MKKKIIVICIVIAIIVAAIIGLFLAFNKSKNDDCTANTKQDETLSKVDPEVKEFNEQFEMYEGEIEGLRVKDLINDIIKINKDMVAGETNTDLWLSFLIINGDIYSGPLFDGMNDVLNTIEDDSYYNVSFSYSSNGSIEGITIESV